MKPLETLLQASIDYAGLFPPAGLPMEQAVANYAAYRNSPDSWMLSRFIVPLARRAEMDAAYTALPSAQTGWPLSVLGPAEVATLHGITAWNNETAHQIDTLETKATECSQIAMIAEHNTANLNIFVEIPVGNDPRELIACIAEHGLYAKIRTGGMTPDLFPKSYDIVRFIQSCIKHNVAFKATAGLHHPLRNTYRLSYEPDSEYGVMYGFMNMFLATAAVVAGWEMVTVKALLEAESAVQFQVTEDAIYWQGIALRQNEIIRARQAMISIGSCSFSEPVEELTALKWLPLTKENQ